MENLDIVKRVVFGMNMASALSGASDITKAHTTVLSTINQIASRVQTQTKKRMDMPESPPSPTPAAGVKSTWDAIHSPLPVSYQIAIAVDAFVLFITFAALLLLTLYIRKQIKRRRLLAQGGDLEMKCSTGSQNGSICGESIDLHDNGNGKKKGLLGKLTRKKGHVRWTSSVEKCGEGDKEMVKMKFGSGEWETDTWGPRSGKRDVVTRREEETGFNVGMRGGGGRGVRANPLGKSKRSGFGGTGGDGEWKRGSLWKGIEARRERERTTRSKERIAAGYDGFRGN